jgi:Tfp pilus assembly protein PilN
MDDISSQLPSISQSISELTDEITAMPEQAQPIEDQIKLVESDISSINDTLASIEQGLDKTSKDLREVVNLLPTSFNLHNINYSGDSVTISGLAPDEDAIFSYASALRSSGRFPTVVILSITETFIGDGGEEIRLFDFQFLLR